jgi:hypothetical protein
MSDIKDELLPPQESGSESNTEHKAQLRNEAEARALFEQAKQRLLNVNEWEKYAGRGSASFQLTDATGKEVQRPAQQHDHFKIDIPGPGTVTGDGYDWAQIEYMEESRERNADYLLMRVRPATNPNGGGNDVAHFFNDAATSNFMVRREGNTITAAVYGRNELPNMNAEKGIDKARNTMVALSAMAGVSQIQWKSLVKGLLAE